MPDIAITLTNRRTFSKLNQKDVKTARARISRPPQLTPGAGCYRRSTEETTLSEPSPEILEKKENPFDVEKIFRSISALNRTRESLASDTCLDRSGHLLDQALAKQIAI